MKQDTVLGPMDETRHGSGTHGIGLRSMAPKTAPEEVGLILLLNTNIPRLCNCTENVSIIMYSLTCCFYKLEHIGNYKVKSKESKPERERERERELKNFILQGL